MYFHHIDIISVIIWLATVKIIVSVLYLFHGQYKQRYYDIKQIQ